MATTQNSIRNPWRARVRWLGIEYYLGSFPTKKAAEDAERAFRERRDNDPNYLTQRRLRIAHSYSPVHRNQYSTSNRGRRSISQAN